MRLVDADKLNRKDVNCANVPMNFIDTAPTVEAIPKDQYENRLKADMVAMLEELKLEFEEYEPKWAENDDQAVASNRTWDDFDDIIKQKIDLLRSKN